MARPLLFRPPGTTVEATTRTIRRMLLLPPTRQFARIVVGVLARAQELYPVLIHSVVMISNHWHLILTPENREQLADFMEYVNGNVAREACRLVDWSGTLWGDRYHPIPITSEAKALVDRLAYHLAHGVKEDLVARVTDWEGLHCAQELIDGVPLDGVWYNRTLMGEANRGRKVDEDQLETHYTLKLAPLPCWKDLPLATRRQLVREIVDKIEIDAAERRAATGKGVVGMEAVGEQDPLTRPRGTKDSPRPLVHAATKPARKAFETVHRGFVEMYREASKKLRQGDRNAVFPRWSFPPGLAFVSDGPVVVNFWDGWITRPARASPPATAAIPAGS